MAKYNLGDPGPYAEAVGPPILVDPGKLGAPSYAEVIREVAKASLVGKGVRRGVVDVISTDGRVPHDIFLAKVEKAVDATAQDPALRAKVLKGEPTGSVRNRTGEVAPMYKSDVPLTVSHIEAIRNPGLLRRLVQRLPRDSHPGLTLRHGRRSACCDLALGDKTQTKRCSTSRT